MSIEHMAVVLHHSKAKGTAKLVLLGIANHDGDGGAWPSVATLARYANVDRTNVQKALRTLAGLGEIRIHDQAGGMADMPDHRRPNRYDVLIECPPWCDHTPNHRDTRAGHDDRQPGLWKTGAVKPQPRGEFTAGGAVNSQPDGAVPAQPEPSLEPSTNSVPAVAPKPLDTRACSECGHPQARCITMQQKLAWDDTHPYTPLVRHG